MHPDLNNQLAMNSKAVADLLVHSANVDKQIANVDKQIANVDKQLADLARQVAETGRQLGGIGNKFGSFTEGLAYRSCKRILHRRFGVDLTTHEVEVQRRDGRNEEYDMIGVANGPRNEVFVVEIKSHLRERDLEQVQGKLRRVTEFLPQYKGMRIRGMIAAVYLSKGMREKVEAAGLYLATGADENFELVPPSPGFQAAAW